MDIDNSLFASAFVEEGGDEIKRFCEGVWQAMCGSAASACTTDAEKAEVEKIRDKGMSYDVKSEGSTISISENEQEVSPFMSVLENGMDAPLAGGDNGTSHNPDGSTYPSPTPKGLWNIPVEAYAKEPHPVTQDAHAIIEDTAPEQMQGIMARESTKTRFGEIAKPALIDYLSSSLGGL